MLNKISGYMNFSSIIFAGDSGSGIQYIGKCFIHTCAKLGIYFKIESLYPSDIKPPYSSTIDDLSLFKVVISHDNCKVNFLNNKYDILIANTYISFIKNFSFVKKKGLIIINNFNFSYKDTLDFNLNFFNKFHKDYIFYITDYNKHLIGLFKNYIFRFEYKKRLANIYTLGIFYRLYTFSYVYAKYFFNNKINYLFFKHGYDSAIVNKNYFLFKKFNSLNIKSVIDGNHAIALGLLYASINSGIKLFYSHYPITPASTISKYLKYYKLHKPKIFQAEDEISAISAAIGASYSGHIGIVATSGPGMSLIQESIGLAVILEIPLIIINVQRVGPSTGIPTKTEQSDLMQALYGRHGEAPLPVLASKSSLNCFDTIYNCVKIAVEYMTPVIMLSDFNLSLSLDTWEPPNLLSLDKIRVVRDLNNKKQYFPYKRNKLLVRSWIPPGILGYENCVGGLEKDLNSGKPSYSGENHSLMVKIRQQKINNIIRVINEKYLYNFYGYDQGNLLILSWGSNHDVIKEGVRVLSDKYSINVSFLHLICMYPLHDFLYEILIRFNRILIFELNNKQLYYIIRSYYYLIDVIPINKIQGISFNIKDVITNVMMYF